MECHGNIFLMDAYIYGGFTEKQKSVCEENADIALVGQEAIAGWGVKTDQDDTAAYGIRMGG